MPMMLLQRSMGDGPGAMAPSAQARQIQTLTLLVGTGGAQVNGWIPG